jgi:hypothetical protein
MPSGGPASTVQPSVVSSTPAAGAVNVPLTSRIQIQLADWVDISSFNRALSITPDPEGRVEFNWRGRTVDIELPEPLSENATYILTLDTGVRTWRGVTLRDPITIAFSTGPVINRGALRGRVVGADRGRPVAGIDIYAYAAPDSAAPPSLDRRPDYRTQTGQDGTFRLEHLAEQPYYVVAVEDLNRNRRVDAGERRASPPTGVLMADTTDRVPERPWVVPLEDPRPAELVRVRSLSDRRIAARFSRGVQLGDPDPGTWALSSTDGPVRIQHVYLHPDDPQRVTLVTDAPLAEVEHTLTPGEVVDSLGVPAVRSPVAFLPVATPDTARLRFEAFVEDAGTTDDGHILVPPDAFPSLQFSEPATEYSIASMIRAERDGLSRPFEVRTRDGVTMEIVPDPPLEPGSVLAISVSPPDADTTYVQVFQWMSDRDFGSLAGVVAPPDKTATVIVEVFRGEDRHPVQRVTADSSGAFRAGQLPPHHYRVRAFADFDGSGRWSPGSVDPYLLPEPITWSSDTLRVRARWESVFPDTLRFAPPRAPQPDTALPAEQADAESGPPDA